MGPAGRHGEKTTVSRRPSVIARKPAGSNPREARRKEEGAYRSNIEVAKLVSDMVKTSLGPRGMDKMLLGAYGEVIVTSDGSTILREMDATHPVARMMVEVSKANDAEVGDGATSAVILTGALLEKAGELLDMGVHPTGVVGGYLAAARKALDSLEDFSEVVSVTSQESLAAIARTSMLTKLPLLAVNRLDRLVTAAVIAVTEEVEGRSRVDISSVRVVKRHGRGLADSTLVDGVAMQKEIVHPDMPRRVTGARIALVSGPMKSRKTKFEARLTIGEPAGLKRAIEAETLMLREAADKVAAAGANVLFCQDGMDDMAAHYLARRGILTLKRTPEVDMTSVARATGGKIVEGPDHLTPEDLGHAAVVEQLDIHGEKWIFVRGCAHPKAVTIFVRGGTDSILDEAERAIHCGLMAVKDVMEKPAVVAGGGAPESEMAARVRSWAETLPGIEQVAARSFAEALEAIPATLAWNAGLDPIDAMTEVRARHANGERWFGIDCVSRAVRNMRDEWVIEPVAVKQQIIKSASEAACVILRVDGVITTVKTKPQQS